MERFTDPGIRRLNGSSDGGSFTLQESAPCVHRNRSGGPWVQRHALVFDRPSRDHDLAPQVVVVLRENFRNLVGQNPLVSVGDFENDFPTVVAQLSDRLLVYQVPDDWIPFYQLLTPGAYAARRS